jgi:hypothetical protein
MKILLKISDVCKLKKGTLDTDNCEKNAGNEI